MPETIREIYDRTRAILRADGIPDSARTARYLLRRLLGLSDLDILTGGESRAVEPGQIRAIDDSLARLKKGEPLSRVVGEREFWGIAFRVTPAILDPRPETETLVEAALRRFADAPPARFLDLGTGSGCIAIALLHEWPQAQAVACDISPAALAVARDNAEKAGVAGRLDLRESDWTAGIAGPPFPLIVSNPPYIANQDIPNLPREVRDFDPDRALRGGDDGLDCYRAIIPQAKKRLEKGGVCLLEIGCGQAEDVTRLAEDSGFFVAGVHADLAGIPRVVEISFGEK